MSIDRQPHATRAIVIACVIVQAVLLIAGPAVDTAMALSGGLIPARLSGAVSLDHALPAPLTLVSSIFLHAGIGHLGFNMLFLFLIGRFTEAILGRWRFLLLFFASGIAGGLAQVALDPASPIPVVGASGAISGVFAAHAMIFGRTGGKGELARALQLGLMWVGLQVATRFVFGAGGGPDIAIGAHIGGFVAGLLLALPLARRALSQPGRRF